MSTSRFYLVILNQDCPCAIKIALPIFLIIRENSVCGVKGMVWNHETESGGGNGRGGRGRVPTSPPTGCFDRPREKEKKRAEELTRLTQVTNTGAELSAGLSGGFSYFVWWAL